VTAYNIRWSIVRPANVRFGFNSTVDDAAVWQVP